MLIYILTTVAILAFSYFYSAIFARTDHTTDISPDAEYSTHIYNKKGIKLISDCYIGNSSNYFAILYIGYGCKKEIIASLKNFYIKNGLNVIVIYANGFGKSFGNTKVYDKVLLSDLEQWMKHFKLIFGQNSKYIIHGFSYTALSCFLFATNKSASVICCDNIYLFPQYIFSSLKKSLFKLLPKKKFRLSLSETHIPVFISAESNYSKDALKIHSLAKKCHLYIYEKYNPEEYIANLKKLFKHLKPLEE